VYNLFKTQADLNLSVSSSVSRPQRLEVLHCEYSVTADAGVHCADVMNETHSSPVAPTYHQLQQLEQVRELHMICALKIGATCSRPEIDGVDLKSMETSNVLLPERKDLAQLKHPHCDCQSGGTEPHEWALYFI